MEASGSKTAISDAGQEPSNQQVPSGNEVDQQGYKKEFVEKLMREKKNQSLALSELKEYKEKKEQEEFNENSRYIN